MKAIKVATQEALLGVGCGVWGRQRSGGRLRLSGIRSSQPRLKFGPFQAACAAISSAFINNTTHVDRKLLHKLTRHVGWFDAFRQLIAERDRVCRGAEARGRSYH